VSSLRINQGSSHGAQATARPSDAEREVLNDREFRRMLALERKRSERTKAPFLLMQAECDELTLSGSEDPTLGKIAAALLRDSRATDIIGWYQDGSTLGMLFTGLAEAQRSSLLETIAGRVSATLERDLILDERKRPRLTYRFFPDDSDLAQIDDSGNPAHYIDTTLATRHKGVLLVVKRIIDIVVSSLMLIVLSPLWLWIAVVIKATSKGPVLFRQKRIGQFGRSFVLLKFRSMHENRDLKDESRITPLGRFLRKTTLDELPELLNVLNGEMSLVGPRPAMPFEVEAYQTWHRRRILAAKPGITGFWHMAGRRCVKFDEMVRMDLRYAMAWTPWLDLKILLLTPFSLIRGNGTY